MKQKLNKTIQKIALILVCITTLNFIAPTQVSNAGIGGVLFDPLKSVSLTIADVIMQVIQYGFTGDFRGTVRTETIDGNYSKTNLWTGDDDKLDYPDIIISPEAIFSNQIEILNIDFINPINNKDYKVSGDKTTEALQKLRTVIASWYVAIRNLALVVMLSILVYVGIKIIISSAASDKAKYKQMLVDWIIGMCLLFMLHYIMAFTIFFTEKITDMISGSAEKVNLYYPVSSDAYDDDTDDGLKRDPKTFLVKKDFKTYDGTEYKKDEEIKTLPNLTAYARFYAQMGGVHDKCVLIGATYLIIYIVLIVYTVKFAVTYVKRVVMIAFLTIIAPFVAMTYPLDKMNDGKAQAFNMWFKEYLFNALIQPFHLVLYTVLIGTSVELARTSLIYAMAALFFINEAEKILKKMFGFDKAGTPPGIGGAVAAGAGAQLAKNLTTKAKGGGTSKSGTGGNGSAEKENFSRKKPSYNLGSNPVSNLGADVESKFGEQSEMSSQIPSGLQEAADGSLALGAGIMNNANEQEEKDNNENIKQDFQNNQEWRKDLTNNQNAELDAYNNSRAYGNGANDENKDENRDKNIDKNIDKNSSKNNSKRRIGNDNKKDKGTAKKMAKLAARKTLNNVGRKIKNPETWKKTAKTTFSTAAALGTATGGFIIGAAKGGVGGAFAGFAAGATIGKNMGDKVFDKASAIPSNISEKYNQFKDESNGGWEKMQENKKAREQQRHTKEFMNNVSNQKYFEQRTGKYGAEREALMAQAAKYEQYEGFEDNDAKMKAIELEEYYKEKGLNDEDAFNFVLASKTMTNEYSRKDLNQKSTYINELNAEGAQNDSEVEKNIKAELLMEGVKHMQGKKVNAKKTKNDSQKKERKAPSNTPEMNK